MVAASFVCPGYQSPSSSQTIEIFHASLGDCRGKLSVIAHTDAPGTRELEGPEVKGILDEAASLRAVWDP